MSPYVWIVICVALVALAVLAFAVVAAPDANEDARGFDLTSSSRDSVAPRPEHANPHLAAKF